MIKSATTSSVTSDEDCIDNTGSIDRETLAHKMSKAMKEPTETAINTTPEMSGRKTKPMEPKHAYLENYQCHTE